MVDYRKLTSSENGFVSTDTFHRTPKLTGWELDCVATHALLRPLCRSHRLEILCPIIRIWATQEDEGSGARVSRQFTKVAVRQDQLEPSSREVGFNWS